MVTLTSLVMCSCGAEVEGVPEGALARVGEVVIEGDRLEQTRAQLDTFGQARFRGAEGRPALLEAIIQQELLVQEARDAGLESDPRVAWAVYEELATLQRVAMLERRLPRARVAADQRALRARYEREGEAFTEPERRRLRVVRVNDWEAGEAALVELRAGRTTLAELGEVVRTPLMARDDGKFPAYHRWVFAPSLPVGALVQAPLLSGQIILVGEIDEIEASHIRPFDDPEVQERLVEHERADRLRAIELALKAELAERFPER